jgi:hypothetical protein
MAHGAGALSAIESGRLFVAAAEGCDRLRSRRTSGLPDLSVTPRGRVWRALRRSAAQPDRSLRQHYMILEAAGRNDVKFTKGNKKC